LWVSNIRVCTLLKLTLQQAFQATQYPRKRLLRDFRYLLEELQIIEITRAAQAKVIEDYLAVLRPNSFRITSESRISIHAFEQTLAERVCGRLDTQEEDIKELENQVNRLLVQTNMSVEILDDDHGKAILVFTIVTLVFLPLSFVTGYLGMNTVDIRNSNIGQGIYWAIALPVTGLVVLLALLVAYKYDDMREGVDGLKRRFSKV
jgi:Mg2+ and Co2+ transporter CorA